MQVFETERLRLRRFTTDDAAFILLLCNDPAWLQFIGDRGIHNQALAKNYLETGPIAMYARLGFGLWLVERKKDGVPLGMCGLLKRDSLQDVDIGYAFLPQHRGQGYAQEAVTATLFYGQTVLGLKRILAITSLDNDKSTQLLHKVGMTFLERKQLPSEQRESLLFLWERK